MTSLFSKKKQMDVKVICEPGLGGHGAVIRIGSWSGSGCTFSVALTMRLRSHRFSQFGNSDSYFKTYSKFRRSWEGERGSKNTKNKWSDEIMEKSDGVELDWLLCVWIYFGFRVFWGALIILSITFFTSSILNFVHPSREINNKDTIHHT